jgi:hypothetical protein
MPRGGIRAGRNSQVSEQVAGNFDRAARSWPDFFRTWGVLSLSEVSTTFNAVFASSGNSVADAIVHTACISRQSTLRSRSFITDFDVRFAAITPPAFSAFDAASSSACRPILSDSGTSGCSPTSSSTPAVTTPRCECADLTTTVCIFCSSYAEMCSGEIFFPCLDCNCTP